MTIPVLVNPGNRYAPSLVVEELGFSELSADEATTIITNTPTSIVSDDVKEAILAGVTQITRRIEIFEADGVTPWQPSITPRLISGAVGLSAGSDSRRTLDCVLDNSDGLISHNPENGLWYDKIVKAYRGVRYAQSRKTPHVGILNQSGAQSDRITPYLGYLGISDITYLQDPTIANMKQYDFIVGSQFGANFGSDVALYMSQAFAAGVNVLSLCAYANPATVPLMSSATGVTTGAVWNMQPNVAQDNKFSSSFAPYVSSNIVTGMTAPTNIIAGAVDVDGYTGSPHHAAIYYEGSTGARWFHYHPALGFPFHSSLGAAAAEEKKLLRAACSWLFAYQGLVNWETQVGEFMIDRIDQPNFPNTISITGRDYSKKLDLSKFTVPTTYASGTGLYDTIMAIAVGAGLTKININVLNITLNADAVFARASSRLDALKNLATAYNFEWFFDKFGTLIVRPFQDPATSPTTLSVSTGGTDGNLITYTKTSDDTEMYNFIIITGDNTDNTIELYKGIAANDDPASPTNRLRVGERAYFYTSSFFTSDDQCQAFADSLLAVKSLEAYSLAFNVLVFPWLEANEIMEFHDPAQPDDAFPTRFLFTDGGIPLDLSPMSGTGKRVALVTA